ncbi:hypothetical protein GCM10020358_32730 [Amorphoplanes nipponensis]|uniref:Uncharacterized protein n=1 Tax=Actinoplanes nipponensis TaxID=135950 RepID=A0A919JKY6_9ACTN|nr:hypothetical protein Ani05nite_48510 [Actinoplanes nipponensis]
MVRKATGCVVGIRDRYGTLPSAGRVIGCGGGAGGKTGMSPPVQPWPLGVAEGRAAGAAGASPPAAALAGALAGAGAGGPVAGGPAEQAPGASPRRPATAAVRARRDIDKITSAR